MLRNSLLVRARLEKDDPDLFARLLEVLPDGELRLDDRLLVLTGEVSPERLLSLAEEVRTRATRRGSRTSYRSAWS